MEPQDPGTESPEIEAKGRDEGVGAAPPGTVVPIGSGKKRGKAAKAVAPDAAGHQGAAKKRTAKDRMNLHMAFVGAMTQNPLAPGPGFPAAFKVIVDGEGKRRPVQVLDEWVVENVSWEAVETQILRYSHINMAQLMNMQLESRDAQEIRKLWAALESPLDESEIVAVREKSDLRTKDDRPAYTWRRLPFDFAADAAPTPTFDEMMARTSNSEALMAWVGSLFDNESSRQQYAYLHGEGRNGKGRLAAFLGKVFGRAYRSEHLAGKPNNFWTSGLLGARLVCFPDFESFDFPNSGFFKMLTGDDAIRIEQKGRQSFTTDLVAKFLFLANDPPGLNESPANRRRAIYCKMEPVPTSEKTLAPRIYESRLWAEAPSWLGRCADLWKRHVAEGDDAIATCVEALTDIMDSHEEVALDLVERWFVVDRGGRVTPGQMQEILRREGYKDFRAQRGLFAFLERRFGVVKIRRRPELLRVYEGISVNETGLGALAKL